MRPFSLLTCGFTGWTAAGVVARAFPALFILVALCGCAHVGVFATRDLFSQERLFVREGGTFRYEFWVDDGGLVCSAEGTWRKLGIATIETTVIARSASEATECSRVEHAIWRMRLGCWRREGSQPFRRTTEAALDDSVWGQ